MGKDESTLLLHQKYGNAKQLIILFVGILLDVRNYKQERKALIFFVLSPLQVFISRKTNQANFTLEDRHWHALTYKQQVSKAAPRTVANSSMHCLTRPVNKVDFSKRAPTCSTTIWGNRCFDVQS